MLLHDYLLHKLAFVKNKILSSDSESLYIISQALDIICGEQVIYGHISSLLQNDYFAKQDIEIYLKEIYKIYKAYFEQTVDYIRNNSLLDELEQFNEDLFYEFIPALVQFKQINKFYELPEIDIIVANQDIHKSIKELIQVVKWLENKDSTVISVLDEKVNEVHKTFFTDPSIFFKIFHFRAQGCGIKEGATYREEENLVSFTELLHHNNPLIKDCQEYIKYNETDSMKNLIITLFGYISYFCGFNKTIMNLVREHKFLSQEILNIRKTEISINRNKYDINYLSSKFVALIDNLELLLLGDNNIEYEFKRYAQKLSEFGKLRIQKIIDVFGDLAEKHMQNDMAEYLFDKGYDLTYEKQHGEERVDLFLIHNQKKYILETKIIKEPEDIGKIITSIKQIYSYVKKYQEKKGYYIIFTNLKDYRLEITQNILILDKEIEIIVIDISNNLANNDPRLMINIYADDIYNIAIYNENIGKKKWKDATFSDILMPPIGGAIACELYAKRTKILCSADWDKIKGLGKAKLQSLNDRFDF